MAFMIYNLSHGSNLLTCNELFAINKSIVRLVIYEVVKAINIMFKSLISWPMGQKMECGMLKFKDWCGLPSVHSTIDGLRISISKPNITFAEDYYYHK
jgi:hypothetical protein